MATIDDVSVLSTYSDVKGIVLRTDKDQYNESTRSLLLTNNSLVGYRVVYVKDGQRQEDVRIITSNNRCESMVQNGTNTTVYRYNDSSSMTFVTMTPSTAPSFKPNATPYVGSPGQQILLVNTKFEPIHLDLEIVENDADTLTTLIAGDQLCNLDKGIITTFNENNEIYRQQEFYSLKNKTTGEPMYHVRKNRENIDFTQELPS